MDTLQDWEVNSLLENIQYCNRNDWEQTRMLMYLTAQVNSTKKIKMQDLISFAWDKTTNETEISNNDIERLKQKAKMIADKYIKDTK